MTTFTIDAENNVTAFASPEEAAAATTTPFDSFSGEQELLQLASTWPADRLVAIWGTLPGVTPVKRFTDRKTAIGRIWKRIQSLGVAASPEAEPEKPKADKKAKGGAQAANSAPGKGKASKKASAAKNAPKDKKAEKTEARVRDGSKAAQVIALLERKNGATLSEIAAKMSWQRHTVRGFLAGAMKKAGHKVESFKSDKGERTYRISR